MALTNAERQKKYREKLQAQNPEKYKELQTKNAERNKKRKKIQECSKEVIELKRKQWRASQNRHRKKINGEPNCDNDIPTVREGSNDAERLQRKRLQRRFQRRWAEQKKTNEERIKKMELEVKKWKKKCKRYMQKNKKLIGIVDELKLKASESLVAIQDENEVLLSEPGVTIQDDNEMTPLTKSNNFIEQNLPNVTEEEKEKVKKQLLTHNVLVSAIQQTYTESKKNEERNVLKKIINKQITKKYNRKTEITKSVFGLKGRARTRKNLIRKNNIIINEIINFYNRDDVSRATAGKKEYKTKGNIKKQRRYLLDTLKELYKKYRAEGGRAKKTSFQKYKPFYVLSPKLSDRETCGCVKHENFLMKIKKLHSLKAIDTTDLNEILSEVVCDLDSKECAYGECSTCGNKSIKFNEVADMNENVTWDEFATQTHEYINKSDGKKMETKKTAKKEVQGEMKLLFSKFNEELKIMKKHVFNIRHQYVQYLNCLRNLKDTEVAIHIDFSENYVCKLAKEVQSMHFAGSKPQVTIHTGVLYTKENKKSFASLSPCLEHGPEAIWGHLKPILDFIKKEHPLVDTVHFFSDGPATQYKQKKNFFLFAKHMKEMGFPHSTWNFSESAHGKGAADGVGGGLKRRLDDFVKHGIDIPDPYTAYTLLQNSDTTVMTFYIQEADIAEYSIEEILTPVPQTMNIHQITITDTANVIRFRCLSCFCGDLHRGYCECFDVKNHLLVKTITSQNEKNKTKKTNLKRKEREGNEVNQVDKGKKKAKVTVLSQVRISAANQQNFQPVKLQKMRKLVPSFDLFSTNSYKENINHDNSAPSSSGTGNKQNKRNSAKKKGPLRINPDDSSTDEDDQYSLHDSSGDDFDDFISDAEEEIEDMIQYNTKNKIHKKSNGNETENKAENFEQNDCTPKAGMEENSTQINRHNETENKANNLKQNYCTLKAGMAENSTQINTTENKAENFEQNDCTPKAGMEENSTQINRHNETENKANNLKQNDCTLKAGMEENSTQINTTENKAENFEQNDCTPKAGMEENSTQINTTENKAENFEQSDCTPKTGMEENSTQINTTENKAKNFEQSDCTPKTGMEENSTQINTTENKAENLEQSCTPKTGMEENSTQINRHNETENKTENFKQNETTQIPNKNERYNLNDSVIVRYYIANKWKHYIGFIEKICDTENETMYTIRFLKTIKKTTLKFIAPRRIDRDVVPEICIVKKVELVFDSKEYVMKNDDCADSIYF